MKHLLLSLGLCLSLVGGAAAQSTPVTPKGATSDAIYKRIIEVDMLIQILPLTLKKSQYGPLLGAIEKARQKEKQIRAMEDDDLAKLDVKLSKAVDGAVEKGEYPPKDLQVEAAKLLRAMSIRRQIATSEMVDDVYNATKGVFNEGQMKVMANSLDAAAIDPSVKKDSMKEEDKIRFFIRRIFLDPTTYDLLLKLQKNATD